MRALVMLLFGIFLQPLITGLSPPLDQALLKVHHSAGERFSNGIISSWGCIGNWTVLYCFFFSS